MSGVALSVVWLTRENFATHKCLDPAGLPATFDEWLRDAEAAMEQLARAGETPERIVIDPHEFAAWCAAEGEKVNGGARAAFVTQLHRRMLRARYKAALHSAPSTISLGGVDDE